MENTNEVMRPRVNYPLDIWGDSFMSLPFDNSDVESYSKQVEARKEMVGMLMVSTFDPMEKMYLINSLYRLGVSYHFDNEIEEQLGHLFTIIPKLIDENHHDLHTIAIIFQVFRLYGYKMSSDVFSKFQDGDGRFKEELKSNIYGIISLYEASYFRTHGEGVLDEALAFTKKHLESLAKQSSPHVREYIEKALFRPYKRSMPIYEARDYISFYKKEESRYDVLLKFAKCNFNWLQLLFRQELSTLSRWYKESNCKSKFPYARHRLVEGFFYAVGIYFEPCYARARNLTTKLIVLIGFLDDSYEAYGLYEELQHLTDACQRFDLSAVDEIPTDYKYQKILLETVVNFHDEAENEVSKEGRSYSVSYTREEFKKFSTAEQVEARWRHEGYLPTFEEYLENGAYTSAAILGMCQIFIGMEEADETTFEWLTNRENKIHKALQLFTRLSNDIVTNEVEEKRGLVTATVCYMKQYNVSRKEAIKAFREMIEVTHKDMNQGCMRPAPVPWQILRRVFNYFGTLDFAYRDDDEFTNSAKTWKTYINQVLIHPIPL